MRRLCILLGASQRAPLVSIGFLCKYSASHRKLQSQINGFRAKCLRKGNGNGNGVNNMLVDCTDKSGIDCPTRRQSPVPRAGHRDTETLDLPLVLCHRKFIAGEETVDGTEKSPTRHNFLLPSSFACLRVATRGDTFCGSPSGLVVLSPPPREVNGE